MTKRFSLWLYRISTGKRALLFLLIFVFFAILVLPGQSSDADAYGRDVGSPDLSFFYSPEDLYQMAEAYGEDGRDAYIQARFTFDVVWPIVYGAFLVTAISWLFLRSIPTCSWLRPMNLVPLFGMLFDYLENLSTSLVMWRYPLRTAFIDSLAGVFTLIKWILISGAFVLLVAGIVMELRHWATNWKERRI